MLDLADGSRHPDQVRRSRSTPTPARSPSTTPARRAPARSASTSSRTTRTPTRRSRSARCSTPTCRTTTAAWRRSRSTRRVGSIVNAVSPMPVHRPPRRRHVPAQRACSRRSPRSSPTQSMAEGSGAVWTMQVSGNHPDGSPFITAMFTYAGGVGARAAKPGLSAVLVPDRRVGRADRGRRGVGADPLPPQGAAPGQRRQRSADRWPRPDHRVHRRHRAAVAAQRRHVAAWPCRRRASSVASPARPGRSRSTARRSPPRPASPCKPGDEVAPRPARRRRLRRARRSQERPDSTPPDVVGGPANWLGSEITDDRLVHRDRCPAGRRTSLRPSPR